MFTINYYDHLSPWRHSVIVVVTNDLFIYFIFCFTNFVRLSVSLSRYWTVTTLYDKLKQSWCRCKAHIVVSENASLVTPCGRGTVVSIVYCRCT